MASTGKLRLADSVVLHDSIAIWVEVPEELFDVSEQPLAGLVDVGNDSRYACGFYFVRLQGELADKAEEAIGDGLSWLPSRNQEGSPCRDDPWVIAGWV